jgi:phosphoserine phosphatase RsbU/P
VTSGNLDDVPAGLISLSGDMRIVAANLALAEMVGRPVAELVGVSVDVLLTASSRILFQTHVYPALQADGRVDEVFLTLASAEGRPTPVLLNAVRDDRSPGSVAYRAILVRIDARSRWERELLAATRELEAERAESRRLAEDLAATAADLTARYAGEQRSREFRDAFVGVVSHELRTPITTIYGMSHILRERYRSMDPLVIGEHLDDIHDEADRLRRLTEDLLVLSRAEGGSLTLNPEPIVLRHVVAATVESERARAAGHAFELRVGPDVPLVLGEEVHVEQVVRNFLSNASKYSPAGTTVRVTVVGEDGGATVRVVDEGHGLGDQPPEQLFELFFRSEAAVRHASGAGIGLFVCRELILALGGRIWARPAPPGAEFGFWLRGVDEEEQVHDG